MKKKIAILVIGPPGAGKSTLADYLKEEISLKKISGGDLLRSLARNKKKQTSRLAKKAIESGGGANDDLVIQLYESNMRTNKNGYVFDGNPSGASQAFKIIELFKKKSISGFLFIKLNCSEKTSIYRIQNRFTKRNDNSDLLISKRIEWYNSDVKKAYQIMKKKSMANININAALEFDKVKIETRNKLRQILQKIEL